MSRENNHRKRRELSLFKHVLSPFLSSVLWWQDRTWVLAHVNQVLGHWTTSTVFTLIIVYSYPKTSQTFLLVSSVPCCSKTIIKEVTCMAIVSPHLRCVPNSVSFNSEALPQSSTILSLQSISNGCCSCLLQLLSYLSHSDSMERPSGPSRSWDFKSKKQLVPSFVWVSYIPPPFLLHLAG